MKNRGSFVPLRTPRPPSLAESRLRLRLMLVALSISMWALAVVVRLVHLQVLERETFQRQAARQSERTITLESRRGQILDRSGRQLALSVDAESLYAVPQDVTDPAATARALARVLGAGAKGRRHIEARLRKDRAFVWVKRKVDPGTARAVREMRLSGIGFLTETRRYYPKRELASQVLGYVGIDNLGMSGIEYAFDKEIRGQDAKIVVRTDARRRPVGHTEKPSTEGRTVVLTLDEAIQHVAERELRRVVAETRSVSGTVVVMEPRTGGILAMASEPSFNPNSYTRYPERRWVNRAVADAYEPGSIFKIVTAAAGLQEKVVRPDEIIDCGGGFVEVGGVRINDHAVFHRLTFRDVVARSSDVGAIRVGQRVGRRQFERYMHDFGFGSPTGVDLPGEAKGMLRPVEKWSALSLPSLSFGQEIGVTALQMTTAVAAVANGGYRMKPLIVSHIEEPDGTVVKRFKPVAVKRVLEPETVDTLTELLKGVVRYGTGRKAAIPGYVVAGKTGTAQKAKPSGGYSMQDHVASFVGFVPASRPALVVLVSLDSPRGPANQGGDVAAPLFARIAQPALRHLGIPPDEPARVMRMVAYSGAGTRSAAYRPTPLLARPTPRRPGEPLLMPDLHGRPARDAAVQAARVGLIVKLSGSGRVVGQQPRAGTEVHTGATCVLTLRPARRSPPLTQVTTPGTES